MKFEYIISEQFPLRHWELPFRLDIQNGRLVAVEFPHTFEALNENEQTLTLNVSGEWFCEYWNGVVSIGIEHFSEGKIKLIESENWNLFLKERFENAYETDDLARD